QVRPDIEAFAVNLVTLAAQVAEDDDARLGVAAVLTQEAAHVLDDLLTFGITSLAHGAPDRLDLLDHLGILTGQQLAYLVGVQRRTGYFFVADGLEELLAPVASLSQQFDGARLQVRLHALVGVQYRH